MANVRRSRSLTIDTALVRAASPFQTWRAPELYFSLKRAKRWLHLAAFSEGPVGTPPGVTEVLTILPAGDTQHSCLALLPNCTGSNQPAVLIYNRVPNHLTPNQPTPVCTEPPLSRAERTNNDKQTARSISCEVSPPAPRTLGLGVSMLFF